MAKEQNIKQLPEGWKWVKLEEICDKVSLNKIKIKQKDYLEEGMFPVVDQGQDLIGGYYDDKNLVIPNDPPYIVFGDHTKAKKYINFKFIAGADGVKVLKAKENIVAKFLYHSLFTIKIEDKGYARHFQLLEKELFPLPPLPTQTAIVAKIEELFSELDKGIEQLKTAQQQLKTYRQAVLKWAFEGKLTKGLNHDSYDLHDEHDVSLAAEPVADYETQKNQGNQENPINQGSDNGGLPEGWRIQKLNDIGIWKGGGTPSKSNKIFWENGTILWVSPKDMKSKVIHDTIDKITSEAIEKSSAKLIEKGSILFVVRSGILRRTLPVAITNCDVTVNQDLQAFTPKNILPDYVYWYVQAKNEDLRRECSKDGTTVESIESSLLKNYPIPVCSANEQSQIVQQIESRLSVADKMEESIAQSLQQAEALRQSILKQAFEGKLVTHEPAVSSPEQAKVIPMSRKVLAGKIIHLFNDDHSFGLTKFQKVLYTVEHYIEADYETNYLRDTAGPYDREFTLAFRKEMEKEDWFTEEVKFRKTRFKAGDKVGSLIKQYPAYFREKGKEITFVLQLLKDKTTHEAELIATLYAVWNNRLIKKLPVKEESLISDFFNWSPKKREEFLEEEIGATYKWMKEMGLVPKGYGKVVE